MRCLTHQIPRDIERGAAVSDRDDPPFRFATQKCPRTRIRRVPLAARNVVAEVRSCERGLTPRVESSCGRESWIPFFTSLWILVGRRTENDSCGNGAGV